MEILISSDDGSVEDLKVAELLNKYDLKGSFYIAPFYARSGMTMLNVRQIRELGEKHEIASHTLTHPLLTQIESRKAKSEIEIGKKELETLLGKKVTKFAYPRGYFNENLKRLVQEAGFEEARTMKLGVTDRTGYDSYEIPVTVHIYPRPEYGGKITESIKKLFNEAREKGDKGYFHLVMHGWEVQRFNLWYDLEEILKHIYAYKNSQKDEN